MDKHEAERLVRAICMLHMDWIEVHGVEYNLSTSHFEIRCAYKQEQKELSSAKEAWTSLLICSPRQWITLLTQHGGGLEHS